jgi:hypothetical protein
MKFMQLKIDLFRLRKLHDSDHGGIRKRDQ